MKKLINSMIENMTSIKQLFLLDVTLNTSTRKLNVQDTLSESHSSISDLSSIFRDSTVDSSIIPKYFENKEPPIICYKYNIHIRSSIFNFNNLTSVADLDIERNKNLRIHEFAKTQNSVINQQVISLREI